MEHYLQVDDSIMIFLPSGEGNMPLESWIWIYITCWIWCLCNCHQL